MAGNRGGIDRPSGSRTIDHTHMAIKFMTKEEARQLPIGESCIIRDQFTGWEQHHLPQYDNSQYLEYETRESGLSGKWTISFCYQRVTHLGNGNLHIERLKISEVPEHMRVVA